MVATQQASPITGSAAESIMAQIEKQSGASLDLVTQFMDQQKAKLAEAEKIADPVQRKKMIDLIGAQFKQIRAEAETDRKDLANIVAAFVTKADELDASLSSLEDNTEEEKQQMAAAEKAVTDAEAALTIAGTKWTWGGMADPVGNATTTLNAAKKTRDELKVKLAKAVRDRVLEANPQQSLATLQTMGERTLRNLDANKAILIVEEGVAKASREESYKILAAMETRVNELDAELKSLDARLNPILDQLERTPDSADLQSQAAELRRSIEDTRNKFNAALATKNEAQKDALEYGGEEVALTQTIGAIDTMMHVTAMKNRNLPRKMAIFTKILQGGAIQEISKDLADIGDKNQSKIMQRTLQVGAAAVNSRQDYFGAQPERIRERRDLRIQQDEARIQSLKKDNVIFQQLREAGIDVERMFAADREGHAPEQPAA